MKMKNYLLSALLLMSGFIFAQNGFHYKFVLTNNDAPLANTAVNVKFTLKDNGTVVWEEEHVAVMTDDNGIGTCVMGEGTKLSGTADTFDDIDWTAPLTYDVAIDDGSGYTPFVTGQQFKYVPLAKYAASADFNNLTNKPEVFYVSGTTETPLNADDNIYRNGAVSIGLDNPDTNFKLYVYNEETGNQNGAIHLVRANSGDNGNKTALANKLDGEGNGYMTGVVNNIVNSGSGTQVGVRNLLSSSGSGTHVGTINMLTGAGTGYHSGEYTSINTAGDNFNIGNYIEVKSPGNGMHVGVYAGLTGTGTGDKFGIYSYIPETAGGAHYGIYSEANGENNYSAYLLGNMYLDGKITAPESGDADLKPFVYGSILADGSIESNAGSTGFTASKNSTGEYTVTFDTAMPASDSYIVTATLQDNSGFGMIAVERNADSFTVKIIDQAGNPADMNFSFVVYKK